MKSFTKTIIIIMILFMGSFLIPFVDGAGWLDGWNNRQGIIISGSSGAGTDYQVYLTVSYRSEMQTDFDDLRFTDDDGSTELDYWVESYVADDSALVWVEVTDNLDTEQMIYMYYGNDAVSTTSNGENTFLFYEDWASETLDASRWDEITGDGSISYAAGGATHGSIATISGSAGTAVELIESHGDYDQTAPFAVRFRSNVGHTVAVSQRTVQGTGTQWGDPRPTALIFSDGASHIVRFTDDDENADDQPMDHAYLGSYFVYDILRDGTTGEFYVDDVLRETGDMDPDTESTNVMMIYVRDSEYDVLSDWMFARNFVAVEPVAIWGVWNGVAIAEFVLPVGWTPEFQFGYDMFFIALGLVMIPFSTLYLVRGGRKEMSRDKLFLGLIIFVMGLGLLIGGITP